MSRPRAAVDTTVIWSGLANPRAAAGRVLDRWYGREFDLLWTDGILEEYRVKLLGPEYVDTHGNQEGVKEFLTLVEIFGKRVEPASDELLPPIRDEYDRMWLAASIGGAALFLVTYDNDFLQDAELVRAMRGRGTRIVKPTHFHRELDRL